MDDIDKLAEQFKNNPLINPRTYCKIKENGPSQKKEFLNYYKYDILLLKKDIDKINKFISLKNITVENKTQLYTLFYNYNHSNECSYFYHFLKNSNINNAIIEEIYTSNHNVYLSKIKTLKYITECFKSSFDKYNFSFYFPSKEHCDYIISIKTFLCHIKKNNHNLYCENDVLKIIIPKIKNNKKIIKKESSEYCICVNPSVNIDISEVNRFMSLNNITAGDKTKLFNLFYNYIYSENCDHFYYSLKNSNINNVIKNGIHMSNHNLYLSKIRFLNYIAERFKIYFDRYDFSFHLPSVEYCNYIASMKTFLCHIKKNNHNFYRQNDVLKIIIKKENIVY